MISESYERAALGPDLDLDEAETRAALERALRRLPKEQAAAVRSAILGDEHRDAPPSGDLRALLHTDAAALAAGLAALRTDHQLLQDLARA